ncbi:MAG: hypothetical protein L3J54_00975 [Draconibacterium sp.]|nr:hypothetical protein [Draconibacterium sp.]
MKTIRLILTFYKSFAFLSFLITFACASIVYANGIGTLTVLIWFKIATLGLFYYYINSYKRNEMYYYKNLGISKLTLWLPILIFDFLFFLITIIILASNIHETLPGS